MNADDGARLVVGAIVATVIGAFLLGVGSGFIWGISL